MKILKMSTGAYMKIKIFVFGILLLLALPSLVLSINDSSDSKIYLLAQNGHKDDPGSGGVI
jgi:hypothetical protein